MQEEQVRLLLLRLRDSIRPAFGQLGDCVDLAQREASVHATMPNGRSSVSWRVGEVV